MIGSGDVDHTSSSSHEEYSKLLEVPLKYLRRNKAIKKEAGKVIELEEVQFVKWMQRFRSASEPEQVDREKLKVVEAIKARLVSLHKMLVSEDVCILALLLATTMKKQRDARAKFSALSISFMSTTELFYSDGEDKDNDISVLMDLAGTELEKIKDYNAKELASLEAENVTEATLQELSNQCLSFHKGILSLNLKIDLLRFHLKYGRRDLKDLVDRMLASVEEELRLYEEELDTARFKLFHLAKKKTNSFGLGWLPDNWKGTFLSTVIKSWILCARLGIWIETNNKLRNIRSTEKEKSL